MEEMALQHIMKLVIEGTFKACSSHCLTNPGSELVASERQCLAMCQDRYQEVFNLTFSRQIESIAKKYEAQGGNDFE